MNAGRIESSPRLQATLAALRDRRWHTTREIAEVTGSQAVHSDVAAIRHWQRIENKPPIECEYQGRTGAGAKVYAYRLVTEVVQQEMFATAP